MLTCFKLLYAQARNQEFLRATEVSWNEGTSINILPTTHQKEQGKILEFFLLDALKTEFQMRPLTHRWTQLEYFSPKVRALFSIFKIVQARLHVLLTPTPPLSFLMCASGAGQQDAEHQASLHWQ